MPARSRASAPTWRSAVTSAIATAHLGNRPRGAGPAARDRAASAESAIEETAPLGGMPQPPYLNQMVVLETELTPRALLDALHEIERRAGRVSARRVGGRGPWISTSSGTGVSALSSPTLSFPIPSCPTATSGSVSWRSWNHVNSHDG